MKTKGAAHCGSAIPHRLQAESSFCFKYDDLFCSERWRDHCYLFKPMSAMINEGKSTRLTDRRLKTIAESIFRELKDNGYDNRQIVNLSTELLSMVTEELKEVAEPC